jgi:hypothetical protein
MNSTILAALIRGGLGLMGALVGKKWYNPTQSPPQTPERSSQIREAVLQPLPLSKAARKKLGRSDFIRVGGTRHALMRLVESATATDSILAICGNKGDYSKEYYQKNFEKCRAVKRIFSYEAIHSEITGEQVRFALDGLKDHLKMKDSPDCSIEAHLIPKGVPIGKLAGRTFNPPLSFGIAILQDGKGSPKMAVVHWEMDAIGLKDLLAIEGVIIDARQQELLKELVKLHESIAGSHTVLSSKRDSQLIDAAIDELEQAWNLNHAAERDRP